MILNLNGKLNNLINKHLNPQNKLHENIILYKTLYSALDTPYSTNWIVHKYIGHKNKVINKKWEVNQLNAYP